MMNKGMIMEVKKNYAIALNDEGIMEKLISKGNMEVGKKVFYFDDDIIQPSVIKVHRNNSFIKTFGSIAALFLLVFTFFQTVNFENAYAVVTLDINPSIQIEADSEQMIIKVEGVNTDGKNIDFSDIKDVSLNDGIQKVKEKLIEKNYLDTNKEVLVGYAFIQNEDNSGYEETLKDAIQSTFNTEKVTYVKGDKDAVDEAKTKGISLGRYEASLKVDEETKNIIDRVPVKDITSSIKDKDNVIQWEATDEKTNTAPITNTKPEEKPVIEKPIINVPSDNVESSTDSDNVKNNNTKIKDDVLELEPELPAKTDKNNEANKPTDNDSIVIEPDGGAIHNNPTSGKIEEEPNKIPPKSGETAVNKEMNN